MDKYSAEENLRLIRDVMESSARYTNFSGWSGIISGILALIGCGATYWINDHVAVARQNTLYILVWCGVLVLAITQDLLLAHRKAKANGQSVWNPATFQVLKAIFPGLFVAAVISFVALYQGSIDAIPSVWALGYGAALCAAGMFTTKEVWRYGLLQLLTGTAGMLAMVIWQVGPPYSLYLVALCFGVYQIAFGILMTRKQR